MRSRFRVIPFICGLIVLGGLAFVIRPACAQAASSPTTAAVVALARSLIGRPYAAIGDTPATGFSCIGFVHYLYARVGVAVPENLELAYADAPHVAANALEPGDLVFFSNTLWPGLSHVAIYAGGGQIIGADNVTTGVEITPLAAIYWQAHYTGATRPLAPTVTAVPSAGPAARHMPAASTHTPVIQAGQVGQVVQGRVAGIVYSGPGYVYPRIDRLAPLVRARIARRQGRWAQVSYQGAGVVDSYGWVDAAYLGACTVMTTRAGHPAGPPRGTVPPRQVRVAVVALRLRRGPSTAEPILALLPRGTRLAVLGQRQGWDHVHGDGQTGWVFAAGLAAVTP